MKKHSSRERETERNSSHVEHLDTETRSTNFGNFDWNPLAFHSFMIHCEYENPQMYFSFISSIATSTPRHWQLFFRGKPEREKTEGERFANGFCWRGRREIERKKYMSSTPVRFCYEMKRRRTEKQINKNTQKKESPHCSHTKLGNFLSFIQLKEFSFSSDLLLFIRKNKQKKKRKNSSSLPWSVPSRLMCRCSCTRGHFVSVPSCLSLLVRS